MLIGCTKNLLEFLKETPVEREEAIDPLYSWTANLIMLNRRKTLVAVNDATKCCFVLHGRFPYLSYPRRYRQADRDMARKAMEDAGISHLADKPLYELSGGTAVAHAIPEELCASSVIHGIFGVKMERSADHKFHYAY